jgi:hypothetical protein
VRRFGALPDARILSQSWSLYVRGSRSKKPSPTGPDSVMHTSGRVEHEASRGSSSSVAHSRVAASGVEWRRERWPNGKSVGGVGECNRVRLEWSEAVSRRKNTREAKCLGEDTRLVCITGQTLLDVTAHTGSPPVCQAVRMMAFTPLFRGACPFFVFAELSSDSLLLHR